MIADSQSDSDEDDDTEDEDDRTQAPTAEDTTDDAETPSTVPAAAVDACEVCFVAPRDARFALVPCGHQRFCESCAHAVHEQSRGCPLCRTAIAMVLRLY